MDAAGNILGITSSSRMIHQFQIGYNENGKTNETHKEGDGYQTYIFYDANDHLSEWVKFDGTKATTKVEFSYKNDLVLPHERLQSSIDGQTTLSPRTVNKSICLSYFYISRKQIYSPFEMERILLTNFWSH